MDPQSRVTQKAPNIGERLESNRVPAALWRSKSRGNRPKSLSLDGNRERGQCMRRDADPAPWSIGRAMVYGAIVGAVAAGFKVMAPGSLVAGSGAHAVAGIARELVGAALAFALLCGIAAVSRNFVVGRLSGSKVK
jgi:hypothetical protein